MAESQDPTSAHHKPQPQKVRAIRRTQAPLTTSFWKLPPSEQLNSVRSCVWQYLSDLQCWQLLCLSLDTAEFILRHKELQNILDWALGHDALKDRDRQHLYHAVFNMHTKKAVSQSRVPKLPVMVTQKWPTCACRSSTTCWMHSDTDATFVFSTSSGASGFSYSESMPVNPTDN